MRHITAYKFRTVLLSLQLPSRSVISLNGSYRIKPWIWWMKPRRGCALRSTACQRKLTRWNVESFNSKLSNKHWRKREDGASQQRLEKLKAELAELKERADALKVAWQNEKANLTQIGELMEQIEALRIESEQAKRVGNLGRTSEIEYGKIPELESRLKTVRETLETDTQGTQMLKEPRECRRHC